MTVVDGVEGELSTDEPLLSNRWWRVWALGSALATVALGGWPAWAKDCRSDMPPALHVQTIREEVRHDPDVGIAELERLAGAVGSGAHPLIGMSASGAGYRARVDSAAAPLVDGRHCAQAVRVRVEFGLADRFIRIAREARGDPCLYALALDHHMRHARAEDEALDEFAPRIVDRIRADLAVLDPAVGSSALAAQASIKAQVEVVVERAVQMLHLALIRVKENVDSPEELARLRDGCDGRARLLSKTPV